MPRFAEHHYVPILTWKAAEQDALLKLPDQTRSALTPLLEIIPIRTDRRTSVPVKTPDEHIHHSVDKMISSIGQSTEFFLDAKALRLEVTDSGEDGTSRTFTHANEQGLSFIPVTGLYRTEFEIAAALMYRQRGICIRMSDKDFDRPSVRDDLGHLVQRCEVGYSSIDLVIDFGDIATMSKFSFTSSASAVIRSLPHIADWRTLTVAGCAFPNLKGIKGVKEFPRTDWSGWLGLMNTESVIPRMPTFGDYAIQAPRSADVFEYLNPHFTPAIRYTTPDTYLIVRGISKKKNPIAEQYPELAEQLCASDKFYGSAHCGGCMDAKSCALGAPRLGSSQIWRYIGTVHHLTVVTGQMTERMASLS